MNNDYRIERDTIGEVKVPKDAKWGAQTERSRHNFPNGPKMPPLVIRALINIKRTACQVNCQEGKLPKEKAKAIEEAAQKLLDLPNDQLMKDFPLHVYQTGSGTQTNMNVNEVLSHLASQQENDLKILPNDDVNQSQSSNDTFPTAMNIAALTGVKELTDEVTSLIKELDKKESQFWDDVKIGRTHLQDATPITFGQEISGWKAALTADCKSVEENAKQLLRLPIGGTAVGTGLNTEAGFDVQMVKLLSKIYGIPFQVGNKFAGLAFHSGLTVTHGAIKTLATDLMKIANDVRFLASGPRAGYNEINIPANEPGSSIMPGKVNPTQAEALNMACMRVMGNDTTISIANSQGHFEMNVEKPLIITVFLQSCHLLAGTIKGFNQKMISGLTVNKKRMQELVDNSLMTVTSLSPHIGYHKAAEIAQLAQKEGLQLKEAALKSGYLTASQFDKWVNPKKMTNNERK